MSWPVGSARTFWDVLERQADACGDREAVVRGASRLTFARWRQDAERVAAWYGQRWPPGGRVLLWMDTSPEVAIALLGLWRAGAIVTLLDTRSKASHFDHVVATVEPVAIFSDPRDPLPSSVAGDRVVPFQDVLEAASDAPLPPLRTLPSDPAYIIFTSGSTGRPKGVTQSHRNLLEACDAATTSLRHTTAERLICTTPLAFSFGCGHLLSMLLTGGTLILPEVMNIFGICEAIAAERPTFIAGIPSLFIQLLRGVSSIREIDLSMVRGVMTSGGRLPRAVVEDLQELLPGRDIFLCYGLTEGYRSTCLDPAQVAIRPMSAGRPIPGVAIAIIREDGTAAGPNEVGEIVHRGGHVCLGYWNEPELTARTMRPDPFAPPGCPTPPLAIFSGDLGSLDEEGYLYVGGRRDSQVKSMGVRVSPTEIEEMLHDSGLVSEVAVIGRTHELLENELWAICVPRPGGDSDPVPELRAFARTSMSPFMAPRRYLVVPALPRTTTGKVDYVALTAQVLTTR